MALVENVHRQNQVALGKLSPKADPRKFSSAWGVVEGTAPAGWFGVGDLHDGITIAEDGRHSMKFEELKINGKTNDIKYHGMTLREMVVPREDADAANRYCGQLSEQKVQKEEQNKQSRELGMAFSKQIDSGYDFVPQMGFPTSEPAQHSAATFIEAPRRGWPKGKKRGPRKQQQSQPTE